MITAKIIADSVSEESGDRLTTLELQYPRYIHAEVMTHRVFSRNAQSSRAIPVEKAIELVTSEPVEPIFMKNQPGMQADEKLVGMAYMEARDEWNLARDEAIESAQILLRLGVHKQIANRILEPFSHIKVILSGTEFNNFFRLRIAADAQQEIHELALAMQLAIHESMPHFLKKEEWHLPYIAQKERDNYSLGMLKKMSVARCARVSYLNHDKTKPDIDKDIELYHFLKESRHMSPLEHVATPLEVGRGNFRGWRQHRDEIEWGE